MYRVTLLEQFWRISLYEYVTDDAIAQCCIHKQKESSGGIYSLFHTKYLEGNKDNCTRAITLRSLAMSVTTSLFLSSQHYDQLQFLDSFSSLDRLQFLWLSIDGACRSRLTLLESEYCPTSFPTVHPKVPYKQASPGPR